MQLSNGNKYTGNPDDVDVETNLSGLTSRARDRNHLQIVRGIDQNVRASELTDSIVTGVNPCDPRRHVIAFRIKVLNPISSPEKSQVEVVELCNRSDDEVGFFVSFSYRYRRDTTD